MDPKLTEILKEGQTKIIRKFISSIDTSKLKNKKLKEKAQKHIGRIATESLKMTETLQEYVAIIIKGSKNGKKGRLDAIKFIQENEYGGEFTRIQATKIYDGLNKIIKIFEKALKMGERGNISEFKKSYGGSSLVDAKGNFTTEMNNILELSGGAQETSPEVYTFLQNIEDWIKIIINGFINGVGSIDPYVKEGTRKKKINATEKTDNSGKRLKDVEGITYKLKNIFTGPTGDFPSEYDLEFNGNPFKSLLNIIFVSFIVFLMFLPWHALSYITSPLILINALLTRRRYLAIITIIGMISNFIFGPLSNIFIQGPLYLFYFLDGQKYLDLYHEKMQFDENVRHVEDKDLLGTYTLKRGRDGPVVVRQVSMSKKEMDKITKTNAKLNMSLGKLGSSAEDETERDKILKKIDKNNARFKIEAHKHALFKETKYDKLNGHIQKIKDVSQEAVDEGHITEKEHQKTVDQIDKKLSGIKKYQEIQRADDDDMAIYSAELFKLYIAYRTAIRYAIHRTPPQKLGDRGIEHDFNKKQFRQEVIFSKGNPIGIKKGNPFNLPNIDITILNKLMNSKKNDSLQLKNNMKFLESEAVRIYKEFEDRNSGEDKSYKTIDKILLGIYEGLNENILKNINLKTHLQDSKAIPGDMKPTEWSSQGGGHLESSVSFLDLYRSDL